MLIAYLLGSISTSTILAKKVAGIDIRKHGSGNAGATNTLRVLGPKLAGIVLVLDASKGVIAVLLAKLLAMPDLVVAGSAIAVIVGHNWPIFFRFRGGKGIATTIGAVLALVTVPALLAGAVGLLVLYATRYVSLAALSFTALLPLCSYLLQAPDQFVWFTSAAFVLSLWVHRANIGRLVAGRENKLGAKR
ncbi:acyl-phosphate glycerol 3-phosphate acyltransferase [Tumebacillus algifaecis]|uniref:Glycerol-3-phosphate acyltransferase n=2 Tax=Tumebacillus algifaecis TaxID=1214604 RepID=A0A223D6R3_9BACL|nr:acyl-phosphate glycerol 3-phosphate acyltransferase [Tumebacillus algifaecis]